MHHTIDINNVALDATNMSDAAEFLDAADDLLKRLIFLADIHEPPSPFVDFICDSPVEVVRRMHQKAEKFRSLHPSSWDNSLIFSSAKTPDEASAAYESAKFPKMQLFLSPETYQYTEGHVLRVPDAEHLRRIKTANLPLGVKISVAST